MMHEEVQKQLDSDFENFLSSRYKGKVPIPKNIIEIFKIGIMTIPEFNHKIDWNYVKVIASSKISDLTIRELNQLVKIVVSVAPEKVYSNFDEAVKDKIAFSKFAIEFNSIIDDFRGKLEQKRALLVNLSNGAKSSKLQLVN